jgi:hypothetical protein
MILQVLITAFDMNKREQISFFPLPIGITCILQYTRYSFREVTQDKTICDEETM